MSRTKTLLLTALAPAIWGTTYLVTTEMLPEGHPFFASLMRALPAGIIALTIGRVLPRGMWWLKATTLGLLNIGAFFPLLFLAAEHLPGGVAAAVAGAQPLIVIGLGALVLHEKITRTAVVTALLGMLGVALIVLGPTAHLDAFGVISAVGGVAATAFGIVLTKRWGRPSDVGAISYAGWQLTAGGLILLPLTLALEGLPMRIGGDTVLGYLWLGVAGGLVSYTLWFRGIQQLPVIAPGLLVLLSPVVATLLGVAFAGESFTPVQATGLAIVAGALVAGPVLAHAHRVASTSRAERGQPLPKSF